MNKNLTEVIFIIDKSGSMAGLVDDTIGGFNAFVESQKELEGEAKLTTVLFSSGHHKLHNCVDIREVEPMTKREYSVGGMTAMLDAIGDTIEEVQARIDVTPEEQRPARIICAITTDGYENSSHKFNKAEIQKMIKHQTGGHGWEFLFLGANMDAVAEAASYGIDLAATYSATDIGTASVYSAVDCAVKSIRTDGMVSSEWSKCVISDSDLNSISAACDYLGTHD